jgi:hypothetical protein
MSITFYTEQLLSNDSAYLAYSVNMSNANALRVLSELTTEPDYSGAMPTPVFHAAVLIALALTPQDAGVPATSNPSGSFIDCGRPEGYLQTRLQDLHALAVYASEHGHSEICWA